MTEAPTDSIRIESTGGLTLKRSSMEFKNPPDPMYPDVFIGELSDQDRTALAKGEPVKGVKLGTENGGFEVKLTEALAQDLHSELMKHAEKAYILLWTGNKIPRGAAVAGHKIGWTQNGQILSDKGEQIGVYDRIMEWGGESQKEQQMIVFVSKPKAD